MSLQDSATTPDFDGHFTTGKLRNRTVNIKFYGKREGLIDLKDTEAVDYYLVLTGPKSAAARSKYTTRTWCIANVYLFDTSKLLAELREYGLKSGLLPASSQLNGKLPKFTLVR